MEIVGGLLLALVSAGIGAFFAVLKSKGERLWVDRYEVLREVVQSLGAIESHFSAAHLEPLNATTVGASEAQRISQKYCVKRR